MGLYQHLLNQADDKKVKYHNRLKFLETAKDVHNTNDKVYKKYVNFLDRINTKKSSENIISSINSNFPDKDTIKSPILNNNADKFKVVRKMSVLNNSIIPSNQSSCLTTRRGSLTQTVKPPIINPSSSVSKSSKGLICIKPNENYFIRPMSKLSTNLDSIVTRPTSRYSNIKEFGFKRSITKSDNNYYNASNRDSYRDATPVKSQNVSIMELIPRVEKDSSCSVTNNKSILSPRTEEKPLNKYTKSFICNNKAYTEMLRERYDSIKRLSSAKNCK
jgi:hypothetical protein